jgi:APA family basic amino acid/polyamine antiporter
MSLPGPRNPPQDAAAARPGLLRAIGRWDLTAAVINGVIGSAIFGMPAEQAALTGAASPFAFLFAGLGVLLIVLCFGEVASRFQEAGGPYLYTREAFGSFAGFEAGWLTFWIRVTAAAANLNVFVVYLSQIAPAAGTPHGRAATMLAVLAVITAINFVGVRQATWTVDAFTLAKLMPLALLVILGLPALRSDVLATQAVEAPQWTRAILLLMFAYGGFEAPLIPAGETRDPRRDSGFALLVALAVIAAAYMAVQLVVVGVVPHVAGVKAPVAAAFERLLGAPGVALASVAAMLSIWGYTTGSVLQGPRLLFSMAERGELPGVLARVHARFRTPHVAIVVYSALALALALYGSFEWNALLSAIVRLFTYGLTCASLIVFRRTRPEPPGFSAPMPFVLAPAGAAFCLWLLVWWLAERTKDLAHAWLLAVILLMGAALWWSGAARTRAEAPPPRS